MLLSLVLGSVEITRYILLHQKAEKTAAIIADVVSQLEVVDEVELNEMMDGTRLLMEPFDAGGVKSVVIVTSISRHDPDGDIINWQHRGGGTYSKESKIGQEGGVPTYPTDKPFVLADGENVITAEFFYDYDFIVMPDLLKNADIYKVVFYTPRKVPLEQMQRIVEDAGDAD